MVHAWTSEHKGSAVKDLRVHFLMFHSFIHMDVSPNTGGHPYIHIYVIGAHKVTDYEYNVYMII